MRECAFFSRNVSNQGQSMHTCCSFPFFFVFVLLVAYPYFWFSFKVIVSPKILYELDDIFGCLGFEESRFRVIDHRTGLSLIHEHAMVFVMIAKMGILGIRALTSVQHVEIDLMSIPEWLDRHILIRERSRRIILWIHIVR